MTLNAQNHPICNILSVYFTIDEGFIQLYDPTAAARATFLMRSAGYWASKAPNICAAAKWKMLFFPAAASAGLWVLPK